MFHPSRGGTRGGKDQFSWEDVKQDKDRENYLGHSLMAPVGRWQKGKDLTWYAKESADSSRQRAKKEELAKIKEAEADAMAVALGVKKAKSIESNVTQEELRYALKKDDSDDEQDEHGLGYGKTGRVMATGSNAVEVLNSRSGSATDRPKDTSSLQESSLRSRSDKPESRSSRKRSTSRDRKKVKKHKSEKSEKKKKKHRHEHERSHRHHRQHSRD